MCGDEKDTQADLPCPREDASRLKAHPVVTRPCTTFEPLPKRCATAPAKGNRVRPLPRP